MHTDSSPGDAGVGVSDPAPGAVRRRFKSAPERLYSTQVMVQNEHREFADLAQAYAETGNHRYARECATCMLQWIDTTGPVPTGPTDRPDRTAVEEH